MRAFHSRLFAKDLMSIRSLCVRLPLFPCQNRFQQILAILIYIFILSIMNYDECDCVRAPMHRHVQFRSLQMRPAASRRLIGLRHDIAISIHVQIVVETDVSESAHRCTVVNVRAQ